MNQGAQSDLNEVRCLRYPSSTDWDLRRSIDEAPWRYPPGTAWRILVSNPIHVSLLGPESNSTTLMRAQNLYTMHSLSLVHETGLVN